MISCLGEDEIGPMVDPTFAFIAQHWESFHHKLQLQTHETLSQLMRSHSDLVRDAVKTIPSLASIPVMSKFEEEIRRLKNQMDIKHQFQAFSQRCQSENATVVIRALTELESYLVEHQQFLHEIAMHEQPDPVISQLIRSVLDACVLFHCSNNDVPILCARCMGLIGCLDPTRIEAVRDKKEILLLSNLGEAEESKDFVIFFLREVLVKAFLSATNPRSQGFLAWAMQEMLKYIEFNTKVMIRPRDIPFDADHYRWTVLPENVKNTLIPFLTSKYKITARNGAPCPYPIYRPGMLHRHWLRTLTFDLLNKGEGGNVGGIFEILTRIIRTQDVSISNFLLPFAALNIVVNGTESQQMETASEMLAILNQQLLETEISTRESLILCSHVC